MLSPLLRGLVCAVALGSSVHAQTDVCDSIATDTTWDLAGSPYRLCKVIFVLDEAQLTIEPGVEVQFPTTGYSLRVRGSIQAEGTAAQPVRFQGTNPDVGGVGGSIRLEPASGPHVFSQVEFDALGDFDGAWDSALRIETSDTSISDAHFSRCEATALWIDPPTEPTLARVTFSQNEDVDVLTHVQGFTNAVDVGNERMSVSFFDQSISKDASWPAGRYRMGEGLVVEEGVTLRLAPGTRIDSDGYPHNLEVLGTLIARGTPDAPIRFQNGQPGTWGGSVILSRRGGGSILEHVEFKRMGDADGVGLGALMVHSDTTRLSDLSFERCRAPAMQFLWGSTPEGGRFRFEKNLTDDMVIEATSLQHIEDVGGPTTRARVYGGTARGDCDWQPCTYRIIKRDLIIPQGSHLNIAAGARVEFAHPRGLLIVEGDLGVNGRNDAPVTFIGTHPSFYGTALVTRGQGAERSLQYAEFIRMGNPGSLRAALHIAGAAVELDHVRFRDIATNAIAVDTLRSCRATKCEFEAIGQLAIDVRDLAEVDATDCWWGDASGPTHPGNPGGTGAAVSNRVKYDPWLTTPSRCELEVNDLTPASGAPLTIDVAYGCVGCPALLYVTAVNGTPTSWRWASGTFDSNGRWTAVNTRTPPGLSGTSITFSGVAVDVCGTPVETPPVTVSFE